MPLLSGKIKEWATSDSTSSVFKGIGRLIGMGVVEGIEELFSTDGIFAPAADNLIVSLAKSFRNLWEALTNIGADIVMGIIEGMWKAATDVPTLPTTPTAPAAGRPDGGGRGAQGSAVGARGFGASLFGNGLQFAPAYAGAGLMGGGSSNSFRITINGGGDSSTLDSIRSSVERAMAGSGQQDGRALAVLVAREVAGEMRRQNSGRGELR